MNGIKPDAYPFSELYDLSGMDAPKLEFIPGQQIPLPQKDLLVHQWDMTSTLENFCRQRIHVKPLQILKKGTDYLRQVVLECDNEHPVLFGAIRINLALLPEDIQDIILGNREPLGGILNKNNIPYASRPKAFFRVNSDSLMDEVLNIHSSSQLFGRVNQLITPNDEILVDVVEVLTNNFHQPKQEFTPIPSAALVQKKEI